MMNRSLSNVRLPLYFVNAAVLLTAIVVMAVFYLPEPARFPRELVLSSGFAIVALLAIFLTRRGRTRAAAAVYLLLMLGGAAVLGYAFHGLRNPSVLGLLFIALPFAGLYFDRRENFLLVVLVNLVVAGLYFGGVNGMAGMEPIDLDDFIIMLMVFFGTGAVLDFTITRFRTALALSEESETRLAAQNTELTRVQSELEQRVEERTQAVAKRVAQLEASAEVAREAASIRDLQLLLDRVVNLISDRFDYYHTGIFLLDEPREYAVLQAASSEGGQRMLARGHRLLVGKVGVVGFAAGMGQSRIAQDVGADVIFYDNPDMPETRSELALPLRVRAEIIGVLDVQSQQRNAFTAEDLQILEILADQIALAIENARVLENSRRALEELQVIYGQRVAQAWRRRLETEAPEFHYDRMGVGIGRSSQPVEAGDAERFLSQPIIFRNQVIGALELNREDDEPPFTSEERSLVAEIMEQTGLALENARLVDQIRLRSDQIQLLQEITAMAASLRSEEELLQDVCAKLQAGLDLLHAGVILFNDDRTLGVLVATASRPDAPGADAVGATLPLVGNEPTQEVMRSLQTVVLYDVLNHPQAAAFRDVMEPRGTHTLAIIPLITRGEVIGTIGLDVAEATRRFDDEDLNLFNQVSAQIAQALDSTRLFQAEQRGRQAAAALLEISQIASSSLELRQVLREVTQRSAEAIDASRCVVFLLKPGSQDLDPVMAQYADGRIDEAFWQRFRQVGIQPLVAVPALHSVVRTRQPLTLTTPISAGQLPQAWLDVFRSQSVLAVPLLSQDEVIGIMVYDHTQRGQAFDSAQIELSLTIAGQVATTVSNVTLYEQTVRRAERERLVSEITTKVRASNDPRLILQTAIEELRSALNAKDGNLLLRGPSAETPNGKANGASGHTIRGRARTGQDQEEQKP
ncbi:MAG: GAF domain-containing protein [Chloroflexi bacterium]|nr:GAF domain-containing protein [Chloroflexota bacterium]